MYYINTMFTKWGLPKQIGNNGGYLSKLETMGATYQNYLDKDGGYLCQKSHGGYLSKLETMGATYQNHLDKERRYLCQKAMWAT